VYNRGFPDHIAASVYVHLFNTIYMTAAGDHKETSNMNNESECSVLTSP
jgi:hypothetical protein